MKVINRVLCGVIAPTVIVSAALIAVAPANASGHTLVVDGVSYDSTHEAGQVIQWETPDTHPTSASFAERGQTWAPGDNGSDKLPCPYGIHWVSNENVLTVSHCLDNPHHTTTTTEAPTSTTTTTTTLAPTTTTSSTTSTSTSTTSSTSTVPVVTTTVPETTPSTSGPSTTSPDTTSTTLPVETSSTSAAPAATTTAAPETTATCIDRETGLPTTDSTRCVLPKTGNEGTFAIALIAAALVALGWVLLAARRRSA